MAEPMPPKKVEIAPLIATNFFFNILLMILAYSGFVLQDIFDC
jgi:hypothetical protein